MIIALAVTTLLTFTFSKPAQNGMPYMVQTAMATYPCTVIASKCIVEVPTIELRFSNSVCMYPPGHKEDSVCGYLVDVAVKPPASALKKRAVAK